VRRKGKVGFEIHKKKIQVKRGDLEKHVEKNERRNFIKTRNSLVKDCRTEQSGFILHGIRYNE
jgi:hypothetical protein